MNGERNLKSPNIALGPPIAYIRIPRPKIAMQSNAMFHQKVISTSFESEYMYS